MQKHPDKAADEIMKNWLQALQNLASSVKSADFSEFCRHARQCRLAFRDLEKTQRENRKNNVTQQLTSAQLQELQKRLEHACQLTDEWQGKLQSRLTNKQHSANVNSAYRGAATGSGKHIRVAG